MTYTSLAMTLRTRQVSYRKGLILSSQGHFLGVKRPVPALASQDIRLS